MPIVNRPGGGGVLSSLVQLLVESLGCSHLACGQTAEALNYRTKIILLFTLKFKGTSSSTSTTTASINLKLTQVFAIISYGNILLWNFFKISLVYDCTLQVFLKLKRIADMRDFTDLFYFCV